MESPLRHPPGDTNPTRAGTRHRRCWQPPRGFLGSPKPQMLPAAPSSLPHVPQSRPNPRPPPSSVERFGQEGAWRHRARGVNHRLHVPTGPRAPTLPSGLLRGGFQPQIRAGEAASSLSRYLCPPSATPSPKFPPAWGAASCQSSRSRGRAAAERGVCTK